MDVKAVIFYIMPNYVSSKVVLNMNALAQLDEAAIAALEMTAEALHTEVVNEGVMPFDTGNMQNAQTFVDTAYSYQGHVSLVTNAPQARRLYFHPEYDFQTVNNAQAGGLWLEPWISGRYKDFSQQAFAAFMAKMGGGA